MSAADWQDWAAARPDTTLLHLDSAACGRSSRATLTALAEHARREAEEGGYVAEADAEPRLQGLREDLGTLLGVDAEGVVLVESAAVALDTLLAAWPLPEHPRIAVAAGEWGPNVERFSQQGRTPVVLPVDDHGVLDLAALERLLATDPPDVVHLDRVAAHRGLVQPTDQALALCRAQGVPLWLDAAQALGHVEVSHGADAVYGTSRKWLTGPRGVGLLAVAPTHRDRLTAPPRAKHPGVAPIRLLESEESHVAGRVGLAVAVREYVDRGPERVHARLREVGLATGAALSEVPGWRVVPGGEPCATTGLQPTAGQDVAAVRARLLHEHRILTSVCLPWRAPEMDRPLLRVSPHVDVTDDQLDRLAAALHEAS